MVIFYYLFFLYWGRGIFCVISGDGIRFGGSGGGVGGIGVRGYGEYNVYFVG